MTQRPSWETEEREESIDPEHDPDPSWALDDLGEDDDFALGSDVGLMVRKKDGEYRLHPLDIQAGEVVSVVKA